MRKSDVRIVYNRILGGWFVVRGSHDTPLGGRFDNRSEAVAWLNRRDDTLKAMGHEAARTLGWQDGYAAANTHPAPKPAHPASVAYMGGFEDGLAEGRYGAGDGIAS
jgi:hypothetical protein